MSLNSQLTLEYFADFMGGSVEPKDVFLAFTVDQGKNIVNACTALGVPVVECNCHRVNSAVLWALGIAGSATTCKNKLMGDLMKKLAALVGVFSHSAVNNDMLKAIQRLEADLHRVYELIRRNDTRCAVGMLFRFSRLIDLLLLFIIYSLFLLFSAVVLVFCILSTGLVYIYCSIGLLVSPGFVYTLNWKLRVLRVCNA